MRKYILLLGLFLGGCSGAEQTPVVKNQPEYAAPDWSRDESIATLNSKISIQSQWVLLTTMRSILDRDIELFAERVSQLQDALAFEERNLARAISEYPMPGTTSPPDEEENFVSYCATIKVQIELLKLQKFHVEDFNRIRHAMIQLANSLPKEH